MRPHHPTPEAIELTEGEKDKIMNDFLLPSPVLENATLDELICLQLAVSVVYEQVKAKASDGTKATLRMWSNRIDQAVKELSEN